MNQSKQNKKMQKRFHHLAQGLAAVGLSAAMAMGLLAACAANAAQPTVTEDDLTPPSTVQDVLEQDAGNGKNYAYQWDAGDIDAALARLEESQREYLAQVDEWLEQAEDMTPEELAEEGVPSIEDVRMQRQMVLDSRQEMQKSWEKEAALDPVVSPQEAANRAGVIFEELYGIDLSQDVLELHCRESSGDTILHPDRVGALRPIWSVSREEAADGVLFSTNSISCTLDGTTGEIIYIDYTPSAQEFEARKALPHPACFTEIGDGGNGFGRWNTEDPSFAPLADGAAQMLTQLLSGSPLISGAQVTDVRAEVTEYDDGSNGLWFNLSSDDGKSYRMSVKMMYDPLVSDGDGTPFPMRGFRLWNDSI